MIIQLLKNLALFLLLMPLLASANINISWQAIDPQIAAPFKIGHGALISQQEGNLLISAGIAESGVPYIAENFIDNKNSADKQSNFTKLLVLSADNSAKVTTWDNARSFSASVTYHNATIVIGGINNNKASNVVDLLLWQSASETLQRHSLPALPHSALSPSAVVIDDTLFVLLGSDADNSFYSLDLSALKNSDGELSLTPQSFSKYKHTSWTKLTSLPSASAEFPYQNGIKLVAQNDGTGQKVFALGGYLLDSKHQPIHNEPLPVNGMWMFDVNANNTGSTWHFQGEIIVAKQVLHQQINTASALGQSHILALTNKGNAISFNAITKSWAQYSQKSVATDNLSADDRFISQNSVKTAQGIYALNLSNTIDGELSLWQASLDNTKKDFGWVNMTVLVVYLFCVVLVGLFFVFKNRNTDDYFRGGQSIPWWAAACSIYATMLSSLTYVALPAVVYQTNWLLLIGIWMIILVAPVAIYVAMPFFRQIDATSAYEYLSKRFNMSVRLFASSLFTLFHIGRMGIVMALTALALSAVTPLSASDSVLIMGVLCLIYCTMGGIEAVIWTDTLQTVVLLVGAVTCFVTIIIGLDGGFTEFIAIGFSDNKFTMVNADFGLDSITTLSIWVIVIGGIGQNISSYTADQAVVQRYMVTADANEAKKSIWANAIMAAPGALLFFCIGTGLYAFYQIHPEKLDPSIQIDQIFPTFIATELPIGIAGLIVAGIFAAAQSTVSTSMNSIATTLVTDFVKPFNLVKTEKGYMSAARWLTFIMGALGTLAGLVFIDPEIRSLMNAYFKVIGMFMGALGGLFVLGALTKKANSTGAIIGILAGVATMISAWQMGWANGYLYATIGIISCLVVGYTASLLFPGGEQAKNKDLTGLTLYTMKTVTDKN